MSQNEKHLTALETELSFAYLGLGDTANLVVSNPYANVKLETIGSEAIKMFRNPRYIGYAAKILLGVDLLPIQVATIRQLWNYTFPIFIGSRGYGKTIKDSYIIKNDGFCFINNLFDDQDAINTKLSFTDSVVGEYGYHTTAYKWKTRKPALKLKTRSGFELTGSYIHPVRVISNGEIVWKKISDLKVGERIIIDRNSTDEWFPNHNNLDKDTAYLFGCLTGDGGYTVRGHISLTSADIELIDNCNSVANNLWGKIFIKQKAKYSYLLCGVSIWDELFQKYGFNSPVCAEKDFPQSILSAPQDSVAAFISGLFDTDGHVRENNLWIEYCSKSKGLVRTLQFVLSRFGIIAHVKSRINKKYNTRYYYLYIWGNDCKIFSEKIGFRLKRKQDRLDNNLKILVNTNRDTIPKELVLDKLLKIRKVFKSQYIYPGHGYCYERQLTAKSRLEKYDISYITLQKILAIFSKVKDCILMNEYKFLQHIIKTHYYYDEVKSIEDIGEQELYDLYFNEDDHSYISGGFISHNSFLLAVYSLLRCVLYPGTKIVVAGAVFRQSKIIFQYMSDIWHGAPILQDICTSNSGPHTAVDRCTMSINDSWAMAIPIGQGDKIRGLRANIIIMDEFSASNPEIYETVISGFAAVAQDPVSKVKDAARRNRLKEMGLEIKYEARRSNQSIISGTADYGFKHFAEYWRRYKNIIESRGNYTTDDNDIYATLDYKDFCVLRIPYELIPDGFMEDKIVARAKATANSAIYNMEYGCIFVDDSDGFFKRSLIEACVAHDKNVALSTWPSWCPTIFDAQIRGNPKRRYVIGVDPASEKDNFSIVVLELHEEHSRVVYVWTTSRVDFQTKKRAGMVAEDDFYGFCARKIRNLMKIFPCDHIAMDSQGGGIAVAEALHDRAKMFEGEQQIWEVIDPDKPKDSDDLPGEHILHMCIFAQAEWVAQANHGLRKDFESRTLLFPQFDSVSLELALAQDGLNKNNISIYDSLEDCILEIEELKDELSTIVLTRVGTGAHSRDRWDTPEIKLTGGKKGRLRKDRYSSLLMANMVARQLQRKLPAITYDFVGGAVKDFYKTEGFTDLYTGPEWFTKDDGCYFGVSRAS